MEKFKELMVMEESKLTERENEFINTHKEIVYAGNMVTQSIIGIAVNLKKMKESKLYEDAGFLSFEEYTESACGIKERQAYAYIRVLEKNDENFLQSTAKIGITKLELLTSLSNEEKEVIQATVPVEDVTVKELKKEIEKIKNDKKIQLNKLEVEREKLSNELEATKKLLNEKLSNEDDEDVEVEDVEKDNLLKEELDKIRAELKQKEDALIEKQGKIELLNKKLVVSSNENLLKFKVKFEQLQELVKQTKVIIQNLDEENKEKCVKALNALVGGLL